MNTLRAIENIPVTYRAKEMGRVCHWLRAGESGSVVGLSGCGQNNFLNFLCHRPDALRPYLGDEADQMAVIPVDLNHLPTNDTVTLYLVILRAFYWVSDRLPSSLREAVTELYREHRATQNPFLAQSALYETLRAFRAEGIRATLALYHFDDFCQEADPRLFATLRGLRDSYKEMLSFIVGMHKEVIYLPDPEALGEMYTLLDGHVCWIGPMNEEDSRLVINQGLYAASESLADNELQAILDLSGGFPVLLRFITAWCVQQNPKPPPEQWLNLLANDHLFEHRFKRLWSGLTEEEQSALYDAVCMEMQRVQEAGDDREQIEQIINQIDETYGAVLTGLITKGICVRTERGWQIKSKLWAEYIERIGPGARGRIWIEKNTEVIYQGNTPLEDITPLEKTLLQILILNPHKSHTYDTLIDTVWPKADDDESDTMHRRTGRKSNNWNKDKTDLQALIMRVRKKIGDDSGDPHYIVNWRGRPEGGYRFYPEGRPLNAR
ncbi:MAG: winged helix-turn-helix domain-containing protein [Anaerolineae bacterium]|nr:winged helix-turn-helix domain-containing protein [Anaerolineae bacterium]